VWLRAKEMEFSTALAAMWLGKDFTFSYGTDRIYVTKHYATITITAAIQDGQS